MKTVKVYAYVDVDTNNNKTAIEEAIAVVTEHDASMFDYAVIDKENTVDIFYTTNKSVKRDTTLQDALSADAYLNKKYIHSKK